MENIVWIASFPRSGNTWLRCFLAGLLQESEELDLERLPTVHCASRARVEQSLCFSTGDLTASEINILRPGVYRHWAEACDTSLPLFVKTHDCYVNNSQGLPIFPADASRAAIYLIRNPLDVCVSYANFWGGNDYDKAAGYICDHQHSHPLDHSNMFGQLYQYISDWSTHVKSWRDDCDMPTKIIRYEDMKRAPASTFLDIVQFLQLPYGEQEVETSLEKCDFAKLQNREAVSGFRERPYEGDRFFRQGRVDDWRNSLQAQTVEQLVNRHSEEMARYGYLEEDGSIIAY